MRVPLPGPGRLRRIVTAYTVNQLGNWFGYVALSLGVYDYTHSAAAVSGLFVAARFVPSLLVPPLVARLEASPRAGTLSALYFVEGVTATALGFLLLHFSLPAILVLVAVDGTAALAANSLLRAQAARPEERSGHHGTDGQGGESAVPEDTGHGANAALNIAFSIAVVAGPALAGVVVVAAGLAAAMFIDAASFVACGALLIDLRAHVEDEEGGGSVIARLRAAWKHLREVPRLRGLLMTQATAFVFFTAGTPVEVFYARSTLKVGDRGYGLLLSVWGAGMVLGSLVFARPRRRALAGMLMGGTFAVGLAYVGLAAAPTLAPACAAAVLGGTGNGVQWASLLGSVQALTPARLHGRIMGAVESIGALAPALGLWLGGVLTALLAPRGAFLVAGLGALATVPLFWLVSRGGLTTAPRKTAPLEDGPVPIDGERALNAAAWGASTDEPPVAR